jgi:hypothetical protein
MVMIVNMVSGFNKVATVDDKIACLGKERHEV